MERTFRVVGIMSGTSMDGVDLALCLLNGTGNGWTYRIEAAETIPYDEKWRVRLSQLQYQSSLLYAKTDVFYGRYLGELVKNFLLKHGARADLVASHGHTVFHDPDGWFTAQVGCGQTLSAYCGLPVVSDFRRMDVAAGGQGAPLAGIGDALLFADYDFCLNLGGFCNISGTYGGSKVAYDIAPCNIILNRLAREAGQKYDEGGTIAAQGSIHYELQNRLEDIDYYHRPFPKSLSREWINKEFWHIVRDYDGLPLADRMKTLVNHIAGQISRNIDALCDGASEGKRVLVTGGGAFNHTLIEFLQSETDAEIVVPDSNLVNFKEALIFALLGALRVCNLNTTRGEYTGASHDSCTGALHGDFSNII
ncbi:MAG: anhydro-N-acetylmuramic acid kinase [Bacteroidetes bacterium]|nr:anhydro-N-acetylmuramic acid kinase [Bacteroidota bacterium]